MGNIGGPGKPGFPSPSPPLSSQRLQSRSFHTLTNPCSPYLGAYCHSAHLLSGSVLGCLASPLTSINGKCHSELQTTPGRTCPSEPTKRRPERPPGSPPRPAPQPPQRFTSGVHVGAGLSSPTSQDPGENCLPPRGLW